MPHFDWEIILVINVLLSVKAKAVSHVVSCTLPRQRLLRHQILRVTDTALSCLVPLSLATRHPHHFLTNRCEARLTYGSPRVTLKLRRRITQMQRSTGLYYNDEG